MPRAEPAQELRVVGVEDEESITHIHPLLAKYLQRDWYKREYVLYFAGHNWQSVLQVHRLSPRESNEIATLRQSNPAGYNRTSPLSYTE